MLKPLSMLKPQLNCHMIITNDHDLMLQWSIKPIVKPSWKGKAIRRTHKKFSVHEEVRIVKLIAE